MAADGLLAGARWHLAGQPIVYLAETPAGSLLEVLVHLELDLASLPKSFQALERLKCPQSFDRRASDESTLTADWTNDPDATAEMGSHVAGVRKQQRCCACLRPSCRRRITTCSIPRHDQAVQK